MVRELLWREYGLCGNKELMDFAEKLEAACIDTIESGVMTGDLASLCDIECKTVNSEEFIAAIRKNLEAKLGI